MLHPTRLSSLALLSGHPRPHSSDFFFGKVAIRTFQSSPGELLTAFLLCFYFAMFDQHSSMERIRVAEGLQL